MKKEHTVLLVDDDPLLLNALTRFFHQEPYNILTAKSAEVALRILSGTQVDVIVSDQCMSGISGTELLAQIRQDYPDTVRIMLTGKPDLETALAAINQGQIYRFFTKPCNAVDLALSIREAIQQKIIISQGRRSISTIKTQANHIKRLEQQLSGFESVERDSHRAVLLPDSDYDLESLCKELEAELDSAEKKLRGVL